MEKFRNGLKKRIIGYIAVSIVGLLIVAASYIFFIKSDIAGPIEGFMRGFQAGIFSGGVIMALAGIYQCLRALKSDEECRKLYIKENDERKNAVWTKAVTMSFWISVVSILITAVAVGFFNVTVFITLVAVLVFMLVAAIICKFIYLKIM